LRCVLIAAIACYFTLKSGSQCSHAAMVGNKELWYQSHIHDKR